MTSALDGDRPSYRRVGDFRSVDGVLLALRVEGASLEDQRAAIAKIYALPGIRKLLEPLRSDLETRGLL